MEAGQAKPIIWEFVVVIKGVVCAGLPRKRNITVVCDVRGTPYQATNNGSWEFTCGRSFWKERFPGQVTKIERLCREAVRLYKATH